MQAPPRPILCCNAYYKPGTYLSSAIPLNYQQSSEHYAKPVAPKGCPFEISPPEG